MIEQAKLIADWQQHDIPYAVYVKPKLKRIVYAMFATTIKKQAIICHMIMTLLTTWLLTEFTVLISLLNPQTSIAQDITSDKFVETESQLQALHFLKINIIQSIAGKRTVKRDTIMLIVFNVQLQVSGGKRRVISSIRHDKAQYLKAKNQCARLNAAMLRKVDAYIS